MPILKVIGIFYFLNFTCAVAQELKPIGFVLNHKKKIILPFEFKSNLIIVKARIDDSEELNFILDSGAQTTILIDSTIQKKIKKPIGRNLRIAGYGNQDFINAFVSIGHTIYLNGITGYSQNIILLDENLLDISNFIGIPIHGVLGSDIFQNLSLKINYFQKFITFSSPEKLKHKPYKGIKIPLLFDKNKAFIQSPYIQNNDFITKNLSLIIDTGGAHALLLNPEIIPNEIIPKFWIDAHLGRGLAGKIDGKIGRTQKIKIGDIEFKNILTTYPFQEHYLHIDNIERVKKHGSIGSEILKRFIVTLNYKKQIMILKPIKSEIVKPFESDMSGLEIRKYQDNVFVYDVLPYSNAKQAGVQAGDQILFLNKIPINQLNLDEIYQTLSAREGKTIQLILKRRDSLEQVEFKLKKAI